MQARGITPPSSRLMDVAAATSTATPSGHGPQHTVIAVYGEHDASVFPLPAGATLADLCESIAARAGGRDLPLSVEVNLAH